MQVLESKPIVEQLYATARRLTATCIENKVEPHLAVVLVGEDPESVHFATLKQKAAKENGVILSLYHIKEKDGGQAVEDVLHFLAKDPDIHGIILQLPLPESMQSETDRLLSLIPLEKDVDALNGQWEKPVRQWLKEHLEAGLADLYTLPTSVSPMVLAVHSLLTYYKIPFQGKKVVTVGMGKLVGQPVSHWYRLLGCQVEMVDENTEKIFSITSEADILVTGTGEPNLVTYQWIKEGATVINAARDVHVDSVGQVAGALSPETGGVGPLTVAWLIWNTVQAAVRQGGVEL
jgi:methylenetetrahydrofolate dehydrogenase (NADP+)/methenyltetrahydrofolate cyclohydrolase